MMEKDAPYPFWDFGIGALSIRRRIIDFYFLNNTGNYVGKFGYPNLRKKKNEDAEEVFLFVSHTSHTQNRKNLIFIIWSYVHK